MLHDGEKYARHGTVEKNGVLVFDCQERAEQFLLTVGRGLPAFKPVKVSPERAGWELSGFWYNYSQTTSVGRTPAH